MMTCKIQRTLNHSFFYCMYDVGIFAGLSNCKVSRLGPVIVNVVIYVNNEKCRSLFCKLIKMCLCLHVVIRNYKMTYLQNLAQIIVTSNCLCDNSKDNLLLHQDDHECESTPNHNGIFFS